jgi:hypothetical protein
MEKLLLIIFPYISLSDLSVCMTVCKRWYQLLCDDRIWLYCYRKINGFGFHQSIHNVSNYLVETPKKAFETYFVIHKMINRLYGNRHYNKILLKQNIRDIKNIE